MDSPVSTCPGVDVGSPRSGVSGLRLLPSPIPLDCYELRGVIGEGTAGIVYLGTDRALRAPVAVREYMPRGLAGRDATSRVVPLSPVDEIPFARGLQAFIEEAQTLARCEHPSLLRIVRLLEANGTAYSVMPHYVGRPLTEVRRDAKAAYDEDRLRALLDELLGALEAFYVFGGVHGGVSPDNVLLLQNGRPVLLRPRARSQERSGEPLDTLTGYLSTREAANDASVGGGTRAWTDVRDAARVIRFLMRSGWAGHHAPGESFRRSAHDGVGAPSPIDPKVRYSTSFLEALDAAESPLPERRLRSVGEFRQWLKRASPSQADVVSGRWHDGAVSADDLSVPMRSGTPMRAALRSRASGLPASECGVPTEMTLDFHPAPTAEAASASLPTPTAAGRSERDPPAETVDPELPARDKSDPDVRTRRMALKSAVLLGILAVPAIAIWLLNPPPVAIQGWSKALVPPSLVPSRDTPKSDATAVATLPDAASHEPSRAVERGGSSARTALHGAPNAAPTVDDRGDHGASILSPSNPEPAAAARENSWVLPQTEVAAALSVPVARETRRPPVSAAPVLQAQPKQGSPREVCSPRTQFALYRCMQTQCSSPKWSHHAQCIRLRSSDEVD